MRIIATGLLALMICSLAWGGFAADVPDTLENRLVAARRYSDVAPMKGMAQDAISEMAKSLPADRQQLFIQLMTESFRVDVLERAVISSMVQHFTVKELEALASFYGSPEGRSVVKKYGIFVADVVPVIQQEALRAQRLIESQLQQNR